MDQLQSEYLEPMNYGSNLLQLLFAAVLEIVNRLYRGDVDSGILWNWMEIMILGVEDEIEEEAQGMFQKVG